MAKYSIKAPDGNTYSIDGPDGATDEQVRAEVLKQNPTAGEPRAHAKDVPSAADNFDPTAGMSGIEKFVAGNTQQLTDAVLGAKQFGNKITGGLFGDKDALAAEAAAKAKIDAPLLNTGGGKAGAFAGRMALEAPAMFAGGPMKLAAGALRSAGVGAAGGVVDPREDYNPLTQGAVGAGIGALGEGAGRLIGKVISPAIGAGKDLVGRQVQRLKDEGMPLLLKNVTDSSAVKGLTDALQKMPWLGKGIDATEAAQKRLLTRKVTGAAGTPVEEVGAGALQDVTNLPNQTAAAIRARPGEIPIGGVPGELEAVIREHAPGIALTGKKPSPMLPNIVKGIENQKVGGVVSDASRGPPIMSTIDQAALDSNKMSAQQGLQGTLGDAASQDARAAVTPTMTPEAFMTARQDLSDLGFAATGSKQREAKAAQEALENAYKAHVGPDDAAAFDLWKKQHGIAQDVKRASLAGETGPLDPQKMAAALAKEEQFAPTNKLNQFIMDSSARLKPAPGGENRSFLTSLLIGGMPVIGGVAGAYAADSPLKGTALGTIPLAAAGLLGTQRGAKYLTNQTLSPEMKALLTRLLATGATSANQ